MLVALSGGVDSSVGAYLLKEKGLEVSGISFVFYDTAGPNESLQRAKETAEILNIDYTVLDLRDRFNETVIRPFFEAYRKGITPNPCVWCNRLMKFKALIEEADRRGMHFISTGHYAIVRDGQLYKGIDTRKDQSYALYRLSDEQLQRMILPLGTYRKGEIRSIAEQLGLPTSKAPESQDVCFLQGKGYYSKIKDYSEGLILDIETRKRLGTHKGFYHYTMGQRKRLGISGQKALYVVDIDPDTNTVYVGDANLVMKDTIKVDDLNWQVEQSNTFEATVKIRSTMRDEPATVNLTGDNKAIVHFQQPQWAPAPGQSAVFYKENKVIGGGIIAR